MSSSSEVGSAGMAGKLSLPDMSKMIDGQIENVAALSAASKQASSLLQEITEVQQLALQKTLTAFAQVTENASAGGIKEDPFAHIEVLIANMSKVVDQFAITAEKTTIGTTEAMAKLTFSAQASFDKVEAVAIKFSGG